MNPIDTFLTLINNLMILKTFKILAIIAFFFHFFLHFIRQTGRLLSHSICVLRRFYHDSKSPPILMMFTEELFFHLLGCLSGRMMALFSQLNINANIYK